MRKKIIQPWERLKKETESAYNAFWVYISLGTGRKIVDVSRKLGVSDRYIRSCKDKYDWEERAEAWDASIMEDARKKVANDYAKMVERHVNLGKLLQQKGYEGLVNRDMKKISPYSLTAMVERGVAIEREAMDMIRGNDGGEQQMNALLVEALKKAWDENAE